VLFVLSPAGFVAFAVFLLLTSHAVGKSLSMSASVMPLACCSCRKNGREVRSPPCLGRPPFAAIFLTAAFLMGFSRASIADQFFSYLTGLATNYARFKGGKFL